MQIAVSDAVADVPGSQSARDADLVVLKNIERRLLWLSTLMIHHANHVRPNPDKTKVGGHQASAASTVSILTALYFHFLKATDRVLVKPHAAPAFHAAMYLMGVLPREYLTRLRAFGGLQAYPSRTKDVVPVDFSGGSMGLGPVAPTFAALVQQYAQYHFGHTTAERFIAISGDAELDEGNIWEALIEEELQCLPNVIWIIDLNRQSLDRITPGVIDRHGGQATHALISECALASSSRASAVEYSAWRDAGVVERGGLENRCGPYGSP